MRSDKDIQDPAAMQQCVFHSGDNSIVTMPRLSKSHYQAQHETPTRGVVLGHFKINHWTTAPSIHLFPHTRIRPSQKRKKQAVIFAGTRRNLKSNSTVETRRQTPCAYLGGPRWGTASLGLHLHPSLICLV